MDTAGHDTMAEVTYDDDDVMFIQFDDEDDGPVPIQAPLPREILEWMYPDDKAMVDLHCQMKLSDHAPYIGLRNDFLQESIVYKGQEPGIAGGTISVAFAYEGEIDPSAAFTLRARETRIVIESDDDSLPVDNIKPGSWFRRDPKPEDGEGYGSAAEPPMIIYDDLGNILKLRQPGKKNYFEAITAQQTDGKNGLKMGHCPYEVDDNNEQDPYYLGPTVGWAPYFLNDMPSAGCFTPEKCLVDVEDQIPLPFVRCLYETDSPLALPYRGQHHDFLPIYRTRLRQGMPRKCFGEASKSPVRGDISLSEYAILTGRYRDWTRLLIGLEMIRGQQNRRYYEAAATGLLTIIHYLGRHLKELEKHNSDIRVSAEEKTAFWQRIREMLESVFCQQTMSMGHIMNGRFEMVPRRTSSAETPLAGRPFRQPGMLPENWWIYGREVDKDWIDYFRDHFWGGSVLENDMFVPVPAHFCGAFQAPQTTADTEMTDEEPAGGRQGQAEQNTHDSQDRERMQPFNIVAQFTMENLREIMNQMYWVLYGIPGEAPIVGSEDYFSKDEYHYLYRMAIYCCRELRKVDPDRMPPSRYSNQKMLRYAGRKYRHHIEEFSV
ncbi:hypothetical protein CMQ_5313 [Grosmannia clavigera kw1407]|uniref:Uncharacterized protein n=1 Tax=Grosmannia clavigera (strain kw1407 / UAMH 11150) TaxID=655863 RepID=F0XB35_GROCL|nr:uncharacterized protein CMQ_5313 [Grosmannia clavigera kw1407]EFX05051.1 hypothetical protein CMQ_5313 [Grosmannia clavigera kw1407]